MEPDKRCIHFSITKHIIGFASIILILTRQTNCEGECNSNPCQNNGECLPRTSAYYCKCPTGYRGVHCETKDECGSNPCVNGGICKDDLGTYTCQCKDGYSGINCQIDIDECASSPCRNNAPCSNEAGKYVCKCKPGYDGNQCEFEINECVSSPCKNGGVCENLPGTFTCKCGPEYLGATCEEFNEEYSRQRSMLWTPVTVSLAVIILLLILAIAIPLSMRRKYLENQSLSMDKPETTTQESGNSENDRKGRVFVVPGMFKTKTKMVKKPILFKLTDPSSLEIAISGGVTLDDIVVEQDEPTNQNFRNFNEDAGKEEHVKYFLARVTSAGDTLPPYADAPSASHNTYQYGIQNPAPPSTYMSGSVSLVNPGVQSSSSGFYVTNVEVM